MISVNPRTEAAIFIGCDGHRIGPTSMRRLLRLYALGDGPSAVDVAAQHGLTAREGRQLLKESRALALRRKSARERLSGRNRDDRGHEASTEQNQED